MIAVSRVEDYRHGWEDVTVGSILGATVAWLTFRRYYPNLRNQYCDTPYPSRSDMLKRYMKLRDEESAPPGPSERVEDDGEHEDDDLLAPRNGIR